MQLREGPVFEEYRKPEVVGPHHRLPAEWLPGAQSVVSYFLPFSSEIKRSNRGEGLPSEEWISARIDGEAFNNEVRKKLVDLLIELGGQAAVPPHTDAAGRAYTEESDTLCSVAKKG